MEAPVSARPTLQVLREAAPTISVGMLTADLARLGAELDLLAGTGTRLVHYDVMDGSAVFDGKNTDASARFMLETLQAPRVGAA